MSGKRVETLTGWMPGPYRYVGKRGTTYFTIQQTKRTNLGRDLAGARRELIEVTSQQPTTDTVAWLLQEQLHELTRKVKAGSRSPSTLVDAENSVRQLTAVFG
jgi:hypothetical protein